MSDYRGPVALAYRSEKGGKLTHKFFPLGLVPVIEEAFRLAGRVADTTNDVGKFSALCAEFIATYSPLVAEGDR